MGPGPSNHHGRQHQTAGESREEQAGNHPRLEGPPLAIIQRRWAKRVPSCPFVFHRDGRRIPDFRTGWSKACEAAGLPGLLFHDLRRSAVRNLRRAGETDHTIMKMAGMRTSSIFERYDIVDERDMARASENYSRWLAEQEQQ